MKKKSLVAIICLIFSFNVAINGQNVNPLRDSLKVALNVLSYHPDSIDLLLKKAAWNIELEQWQYAKDSYDIVLAKEPTNIAALYFRAFANEKLGRYNFARLDYEHLLTIVPGNFQAQLGFALLNQKDKHYTEAMDMINRMASIFPDSAVVYAARADMEKERHLYELAEYDLTKAILLEPNNIDYITNRIDVRLNLKKWDDAQADVDLLIKLGVAKPSLVSFTRRIRKHR